MTTTTKTCWICGLTIPPGEKSRDHIVPRSLNPIARRGNTRWADKECNNARGTLPAEIVEALQAQGLSQDGIRAAMIVARRERWQPNVSREACYD